MSDEIPVRVKSAIKKLIKTGKCPTCVECKAVITNVEEMADSEIDGLCFSCAKKGVNEDLNDYFGGSHA